MNNDNRLEDVWFISGGNEIFIFSTIDRNNEPLYIKNCEIKWTLCDIGCKDSPIIIKDNKLIGGIVFIDDSTCRVEIDDSDTVYLYDNKYEHELIIIQPNGKVLRPSYGYVTVRRGSSYQ